LVEDAAQAFGTRLNGQAVGTFGDAGIYSFGLYKNVNSFYGGMLVTPHADLAAAVRTAQASWPVHPLSSLTKRIAYGAITDCATWPPLFRSFTYWVFRFGYLNDISLLNRQVTIDVNPALKTIVPEAYRKRMTPLQARLARHQLKSVNSLNTARINAAKVYHEGLSDLPDVIVPPLRTDGSHTYTYFPLQVPDRTSLIRHMVRSGRDVAVQHLRNCAELPCFAAYS